jgi:hypothetical protein
MESTYSHSGRSSSTTSSVLVIPLYILETLRAVSLLRSQVIYDFLDRVPLQQNKK